MAIKRIDPKAVTKLVSVQDHAIDPEKSELTLYGETLNVKHLTFREGEVPTYFLAKTIGATTKVEIEEGHLKFSPQPGKDEKGKPMPPKVEFINNGAMLVKYFQAAVKQTEEGGTIADVNPDELPGAVVTEIGAYVMRRSTLGE